MEIKNPIVNSIIHMIIFFLITEIVGLITKKVTKLEINDPITLIIIAIILLLIYILIYRRKFKEIITTKNLKSGLILGLPILLLIFGPYIFNIDAISTLNLSLYGIIFAIILGLIPGISEEVIFRGALINGFMDKIKKENYIPIAVLLSAIFFAVFHSINIFGGADLNQTILQIIYTFALGAILAAIFLRTGNILIPIFYHTLMDFIGLLEPEIAQTGGVLQTSINLLAPENIATIVISVVLIIIAFYYVKSEKRSEIIELWNLKKIKK